MALTRSLNVYNGSDSTPVTDVTDRTDWPGTELTSMANLGEAAASQWLMRDEGGTIPDFVAPGELIDAHNIIVATVGSNTLFRGRIATDEHFRGRQKAGRAKEITFNLEDANSHLRGMIVHEWIRPAETDAARAQALVAAYLSGSPRPTTNLNGSNLIITGSNAIALPAKTYSGVTPWEVMSELASNSDKEMFVTVDNELAYFGHDYAGYASLLRISDDPADQNATTYAPWDPHGFEFGRQKLSALRVYYGTDVTQSTIQLTNSNAPRFDYWEDVFWDSESVTAAQAEARAQKMLDYRSTDDLSYSFSIGPMSGDEIWKIKPGQSILLKARAARGGRNSDGSYTGDFFLSTRVREIAWTMPNEDQYHARIAIERPKRTQSTGSGSQPLTIMPEPAPVCLVSDPGGIGAPVGGAGLFCTVADHFDACGPISDPYCANGSLPLGSTDTTLTPGFYYSEVLVATKYGGSSPCTFKVTITDSSTTLPDFTLTLDSTTMIQCRHGGDWYTLSSDFEVPTGYDTVHFILQMTGGMLIKEDSHILAAFTPPADPPENDPFCLPDPGDSPYFMRSDDPRFEAVQNSVADLVGFSGLSWKQPVRAATTAAGTLATSFEASDTVDGVVLVEGDRILIKDQAAGVENGIYVVAASGAPARAVWFDTGELAVGAAAFVSEGTANANRVFVQTANAPLVLDTDALVFAELSGGAGSALDWFVVTDYGAVGDDTTDDTTAIQAAIDACIANGTGIVYFPSLTYKITALLNIHPGGAQDGIHLLGAQAGDAGNGPAIHQVTSNTGALHMNTNAYTTYISDLSFRGPTTHASGVGIESVRNVIFHNVWAASFGTGVKLGSSSFYSKAYRLGVYNCGIGIQCVNGSNNTDFLSGRVTTCTTGYSILGCEKISIIGGEVEGCTTGILLDSGSNLTGGVTVEGVYFENSAGSTDIRVGDTTLIRGAIISGNKFTAHSTGFHIDAQYVDALIVHGNDFRKTTGTAIRTQAPATGVIIGPDHYAGATNSLSGNARIIDPETDVTPAADSGAGSAGTSRYFPRADHVHPASSGNVAADAIWDAKGDLAVGTGADTAAKLTAGANDTILMAESGEATGLKWVASQTPSTQAFSDAAAEGTADTYSRGDHKHGMPAATGGIGEILISDTPSTPLIFADLIQNEAQDDLVYADP